MALEISKKDKVRSDFESFILYFLRATIHLPYIWYHLRNQEEKKKKTSAVAFMDEATQERGPVQCSQPVHVDCWTPDSQMHVPGSSCSR